MVVVSWLEHVAHPANGSITITPSNTSRPGAIDLTINVRDSLTFKMNDPNPSDAALLSAILLQPTLSE